MLQSHGGRPPRGRDGQREPGYCRLSCRSSHSRGAFEFPLSFCDLIHPFFQSFTLVLDNIVNGEIHTVALAKQLASSFFIRGAQLSVVRRIDSQYIVQMQTNLLTWIGKRLATYESNKNKKSRKTAILFFRVLIPMLTTLDSRDALKM